MIKKTSPGYICVRGEGKTELQSCLLSFDAGWICEHYEVSIYFPFELHIISYLNIVEVQERIRVDVLSESANWCIGKCTNTSV